MTGKPERPTEGGSYLVQPDGKLVRQAGTIGPLDPQHPNQLARRKAAEKRTAMAAKAEVKER